MIKTYRVREPGTDTVNAFVRTEIRDGGFYVSVRFPGSAEWVEEPDAYGLLLGDDGTVEEITAAEADALTASVQTATSQATT